MSTDAPNAATEPDPIRPGTAPAAIQDRVAGNGVLAAVVGTAFSLCFYGVVVSVTWAPLQRYFLGHPVAVAATVLFWFAIAVLISKWLGVVAQANQLDAIRDQDLLPPTGEDTPAERWLHQNDAGHVARSWLAELGRLPAETQSSHLVGRLIELLTRQSQRGTTKHLADDLRELSSRDADAAHDSLGLVRIIVWAIPMLGFLGTVIGITQTLGGLDFSNGTAAVQNLKSGLYVAFDTTALGLVLSVIAIFAQFPIERGEQRLLANIDARVGHLLSDGLPSDEASDNQTQLIAELCGGVQAAVAESLENQARLWRQTIDEAQLQWQSVHEQNNERVSEAIESMLVPALQQHAESLTKSSRVAGEQLNQQCHRLVDALDEAQHLARTSSLSAAQKVADCLNTELKPALVNHAASLEESARTSIAQLEQQSRNLADVLAGHSASLSVQQDAMVRQSEAFAKIQTKSESIATLQKTLDDSMLRLTQTNQAVERSVAASAGDGMADAMRILARAVDVLAKRLAQSEPLPVTKSSRRAA